MAENTAGSPAVQRHILMHSMSFLDLSGKGPYPPDGKNRCVPGKYVRIIIWSHDSS